LLVDGTDFKVVVHTNKNSAIYIYDSCHFKPELPSL